MSLKFESIHIWSYKDDEFIGSRTSCGQIIWLSFFWVNSQPDYIQSILKVYRLKPKWGCQFWIQIACPEAMRKILVWKVNRVKCLNFWIFHCKDQHMVWMCIRKPWQWFFPNHQKITKVPHTLLPTCWILRNTGFQVGSKSSFMTSVLQIGIEILLSAILDITKKGSCRIWCKRHAQQEFLYSTWLIGGE